MERGMQRFTADGQSEPGRYRIHCEASRPLRPRRCLNSEHGDNTNQQAIWSLIANKTAINLVGHNHTAPRRGGLSAGRQERHRLRLGHDHMLGR
jgi:hypothetical protein